MPRTRSEERIIIPQSTRWQVFKDCNCICTHCGKKLDFSKDFTIEHVIPLNKGGRNDIKNFVALCKDCNKAKSDDIIQPIDYYPYLSETRKAQLQTLFDDYIKSNDWLAHDNLFLTDRFDLEMKMPIINPKTRKILSMPATMRVEKMRETAVLDWLLPYTGRLATEDKDIMAYDQKHINTPYYHITHNGASIMLFSAYVDKLNTQDISSDENCKNTLVIDIFVNPDIKVRDHTIIMLYSTVHAVLRTIQKSIMRKHPGTIIDCIIRTPHSDTLGHDTIIELNHNMPYFQIFRAYTGLNETSGCIIGVIGTLFQGTYQDLLDTTHAHGMKSTNEFAQSINMDNFRQSLDADLDQSPDIQHETPRKKRTKKDKKSKHKKPKHHK